MTAFDAMLDRQACRKRNRHTCRNCNGSGQSNGALSFRTPCEDCEGRGFHVGRVYGDAIGSLRSIRVIYKNDPVMYRIAKGNAMGHFCYNFRNLVRAERALVMK